MLTRLYVNSLKILSLTASAEKTQKNTKRLGCVSFKDCDLVISIREINCFTSSSMFGLRLSKISLM